MNLKKTNWLFTLALLFVCRAASATPNRVRVFNVNWGWYLLAIIFLTPLPAAFIFSFISIKKESRRLTILALVFTGMVWYESFIYEGWADSYFCSGLTALCIGMLLSKIADHSIGFKFVWLKILIIILYLFSAKYLLWGIVSITDMEQYCSDRTALVSYWLYHIGFLVLQVYLLSLFLKQRRVKNLPPYNLLQSLGIGLVTGIGSWLISIVFVLQGLEMVLNPFIYSASPLYFDASIWLLSGLLVFALNRRHKP